MNSLRRIDLPQVLGILLLGGIALSLPTVGQAAPAVPAEASADAVVTDADVTDTIQLQPQLLFDDPRPESGADRNLLQGQLLFDDERVRPSEDTIQLQPQLLFDDPRPEAGADRNLLQGQLRFDDPRPDAGDDRIQLREARYFDDPRPQDPPRAQQPPHSAVIQERPSLSMNPSTGPVTVMYGQDDLRVEVYEVTGRRVAAFDGYSGRAQWDGRDDYGRPVARGIYFARVMSGQGTPAAVVRIVRR